MKKEPDDTHMLQSKSADKAQARKAANPSYDSDVQSEQSNPDIRYACGVTEAEIQKTISQCISKGMLVYDPLEETYTCHAPVDNIELWVRFHLLATPPAGMMPAEIASAVSYDRCVDFEHSTENAVAQASPLADEAVSNSKTAVAPANPPAAEAVSCIEANTPECGIDSLAVDEIYCNRTRITEVRVPTPQEAKRLSPLIFPWIDRELICVKCDLPLEPRKVIFRYLNQPYHAIVPACPRCGQVFEPPEFIRYQSDNIERILEGK